MRILNLFSGLGGNRADWDGHDVVAVEKNPEVASIYERFFPEDLVYREDACELLPEIFKDFEFIWASPPCQTHSRYSLTRKPVMMDMQLWQVLMFLRYHYDGPYCVENVRPYYKPLIKPTCIRGRHALWTNFYVPEFNVPELDLGFASVEHLKCFHGYDLTSEILNRADLRNMCHRSIGAAILDAAIEFTRENEYEVTQLDAFSIMP